MLELGIYLMPAKGIKNRFTSLRKRISKKYTNNLALKYPIHITILGVYKIGDYQEYLSEISKICKSFKPFNLTIKKIGFIKRLKNHCGIWFKPNKRFYILRRRIRVLARKFIRGKQEGIFPYIHISLGFGKMTSLNFNELKQRYTKYNLGINKLKFSGIYIVKGIRNKVALFKEIKFRS